jgi:hypothetical protein
MRLVAALLFTAACAFAQDQSAVTAAESACGPAGVHFDAKHDDSQHAIAQPETGKALVYVIQDIGVTNCLGACITTRVGLDGTWVGANVHNSYFSFSVGAGEHHLCVNHQSHLHIFSQMVALARLTAEPGKTYYFRTRTTTGGRDPLFLDLDAIDPDQARLFIASYPLSVSHPRK